MLVGVWFVQGYRKRIRFIERKWYHNCANVAPRKVIRDKKRLDPKQAAQSP